MKYLISGLPWREKKGVCPDVMEQAKDEFSQLGTDIRIYAGDTSTVQGSFASKIKVTGARIKRFGGPPAVGSDHERDVHRLQWDSPDLLRQTPALFTLSFLCPDIVHPAPAKVFRVTGTEHTDYYLWYHND